MKREIPQLIKSHIEKKWVQPTPFLQELEDCGIIIPWIRCSMQGYWIIKCVLDEEIEVKMTICK